MNALETYERRLRIGHYQLRREITFKGVRKTRRPDLRAYDHLVKNGFQWAHPFAVQWGKEPTLGYHWSHKTINNVYQGGIEKAGRRLFEIARDRDARLFVAIDVRTHPRRLLDRIRYEFQIVSKGGEVLRAFDISVRQNLKQSQISDLTMGRKLRDPIVAKGIASVELGVHPTLRASGLEDYLAPKSRQRPRHADAVAPERLARAQKRRAVPRARAPAPELTPEAGPRQRAVANRGVGAATADRSSRKATPSARGTTPPAGRARRMGAASRSAPRVPVGAVPGARGTELKVRVPDRHVRARATRSGGLRPGFAVAAAGMEFLDWAGRLLQQGVLITTLESVEDRVEGTLIANPGKGAVVELTWEGSYPTGSAVGKTSTYLKLQPGETTVFASLRPLPAHYERRYPPNILVVKRRLWIPPLPADYPFPPERGTVRPRDLSLPDIDWLRITVSAKMLLEDGRKIVASEAPGSDFRRWIGRKNAWNRRVEAILAQLDRKWDKGEIDRLGAIRDDFNRKAAKILQAAVRVDG